MQRIILTDWRYIYDVTRLFNLPEIREFLNDTDKVKCLIKFIKETDSYYLTKRNISKEYDPTGPYDFESWQKHFIVQVKSNYKNLSETLLYTDEKQNFSDAVRTFQNINKIFKSIGE